MNKVPVKLAVYGTLRKGFHNHFYLENCSKYLGTYNTDEGYTMYKANGFPIVSTVGNTSIEYELYLIEDIDVLKAINKLEGYTGEQNHRDNWYNVHKIETPEGIAYMYVMNQELGLNKIKSGIWKK